MSLKSALVRCWYGRFGWCWILAPLAMLFAALTWLRRRLYRAGWRRSTRLPMPVIVVGNLTTGGTGKTPLTIWLAQRLRAHGYRPGVVSRGYGGDRAGPSPVTNDSVPGEVGDEPLLILRRAGCPVWIGRRRAEAGAALLAAHPEVTVILADDGLQHYALARDVEIVVVDGLRRFGNGWCLPAGPLREPVGRLKEADAVVVNGGVGLDAVGCPAFAMGLAGARFHALHDVSRTVAADYFSGQVVHAVAGIGNPGRFFETLTALGLSITPHSFPDHYIYRPGDLPPGTVVMTEKDAVKCAALDHSDAWVLTVDAEVSEGLERLVLEKLGTCHG